MVKMKKIIVLLSLLIVTGYCNAQYRIQKARAFFTVSIGGMQRVDEHGNKIDPERFTGRFIYIECRYNGKPKVDSVFYNGILFSASVADKEETTNKIGIQKDNGKPVTWIPRKGNHIWKIDLLQADGNTLPHKALKKIVVKGKLDKIKFSYIITSETELTTPDMY